MGKWLWIISPTVLTSVSLQPDTGPNGVRDQSTAS
jgi:hypothetical protein